MIKELETNYRVNPIGIELENIVFTWKQDMTYEKADFLISLDESFNNIIYKTKVSMADAICFTPKLELSGGQRYYWKVMDSKTAYFEGGHPDEEWTGKWITPRFVPEYAPVFRKSFRCDSKVEKARLYICGLGLYEVYINGKKVGDEFLTPYFTDYRYHIEYQTYEVDDYIEEGDNVLTVFLGAGWYKGRLGYNDNGHVNHYGFKYKLLCDLYLYDSDVRIIGSDESFSVRKSPIVESGIYDGEVYDARIDHFFEMQKESDIKAVIAKKPEGKLIPMLGTRVIKKEILQVKGVITTKAGETLLDFGQEISGFVSFKAHVPKDTRIKLSYSEIMQNDSFYRDNLRSAKAEYVYISDGNERIVRPHFTFYGFRYVKVEGINVDKSNMKDFEGWVLYSDLKETGVIETDNKLINRLIMNTKWSQKGNFIDVPTDCPQRDERLGWTGDAQIFSSAASYHMETPAFYRKYLKDMYYEQAANNGSVPFVVPDVLSIERIQNAEPAFMPNSSQWGESGSAAWGDAATVIPWNMYIHYGNRKWLQEQYENMKLWTDFIINMDETYCEGKRLWTCGFHFGDWLSLDAPDNDLRGGTDVYYISSMYYMYSAMLTAKAAKVLEHHEDEKYYRSIYDEVRSAIRNKYLADDCSLQTNTQTAYAIGIVFGLFTDVEKEIAGKRLVELLYKNNGKLSTGFVGTGYLCEALSEIGQDDLALDILFNEEYPGWLYEVKMGATTIWERWNSVLPDGSISDTGMNSLNHYAYGSIVAWMYRHLCGIKYDENNPAGRKMIIEPLINNRLNMVFGSVNTMAGKYDVMITKADGKTDISIEIPAGGSALLILDNTKMELTQGRHTLSL